MCSNSELTALFMDDFTLEYLSNFEAINEERAIILLN